MSGFLGNCPGLSIWFGGVPGKRGIFGPTGELRRGCLVLENDSVACTAGLRGIIPGDSLLLGTSPCTPLTWGKSADELRPTTLMANSCDGDMTTVLGVLFLRRNMSSILLPSVSRSPCTS